MHTTFLIIPGYGNSGPEHWQSLWQQQDARFRRVEQRDWWSPQCSEWVAALERAVTASGPDTVLVAHSLGCGLVAHWAAQTRQRIRAAMLVAPPDPEGPAAELNIQGFVPVPDPKLERGKPRAKITTDLPSPLDTRAQLTFLKSKVIDDPDAVQYRPQLIEVAPGHLVAEHD